MSRTATVTIDIGSDAYFDNQTILNHFERLFLLLEFKPEYKNRAIEIVADNARTHTTKSYSLLGVGKNNGTLCAVEKVEYVNENGVSKVIGCYFKQRVNEDV